MQYQGVLSQLRNAIDVLDTADITAVDVEDLSQLVRRLSVIHLRALDGLDAPGAARVCGVSVGSVRARRASARKVAAVPEVAAAVASGEISSEAGHVLATSPDIAGQLLETAAGKTPADLRTEVEWLKSSAESEAEHQERLLGMRSFRSWVDIEGMVNVNARLVPEDAALVLSQLRAQEASLARKIGSSTDAHRADAFVDLFRFGAGAVRSVVNIHVDYESLCRGWVERDGFSEVAGLGPMPVANVRSCFAEATLQVLLTQNNRLIWVGRTPSSAVPERIKEAVRAHFRDRCSRCGEPSSAVDHVRAKFNGGGDEISNLQGLCAACHGDKTVAEVPYGHKYYSDREPRAG